MACYLAVAKPLSEPMLEEMLQEMHLKIYLEGGGHFVLASIC